MSLGVNIEQSRNMKRIFLSILVIINLLFVSFPVLAQDVLGGNPHFFPGLNCGIAEDPNKNYCCQFFNPENIINDQFINDVSLLKKIIPFPFDRGFSMFFSTYNLFKKIYLDSIGRNDLICQQGYPSTENTNSPSCRCINPVVQTPQYLSALNSFCQNQSKPSERVNCLNCANQGGVWTGIGCVRTDFKGFIEETVFRLGIGMAGGFSLLCIIYAAFMMQSSQGNPEKLKKAQELITSCIMGLMLIIFSVFILRLIGVNILGIPGFK